MLQNILVTGGAGYVGSHTVRELLKGDYNVVVYDNLSRGFREALPRGIELIQGDLNNSELLEHVFKEHNFEGVVDLAGDIEIEESMRDPHKFCVNNVSAFSNLLTIMRNNDVKKIVYSSSASVYGQPKEIPIPENSPIGANNIYGTTKIFAEQLLKAFDNHYLTKFVSLRYFNVAGADQSGDIGEAHNPETHLIPNVLKVALGQNKLLPVNGDDYPTKDGTCVRDYVHVTDLSRAHVKAMKKLFSDGKSEVYNVGTGKGYSVREIIETARKITGHEIPISIRQRRQGDPAELVAGVGKIKRELSWKPQYGDLETIIETAWIWHKNHPRGYKQN